MARKATGLAVALIAVGALDGGPQAPPTGQAPASIPEYRAVVNKYCVTCHNEKLKTANLMLDKLDIGNVPAGAETWEKVIAKLRGDAMPPPGLPRPDKATYNALATYLETTLDREAMMHPDPGRPAVHRLNRAEYANSVRDMLAVNVDFPGWCGVRDSSVVTLFMKVIREGEQGSIAKRWSRRTRRNVETRNARHRELARVGESSVGPSLHRKKEGKAVELGVRYRRAIDQ